MEVSIPEKKKVGRPRKNADTATKETGGVSKRVVQTSVVVTDISKGEFKIESLKNENSLVAAEEIIRFWAKSPYSKSKPNGLYALYGPNEAYVVVRDDSSEPLPNVGNDVFVLANTEQKSKLYAVVKSKCNFVSFGKCISGGEKPLNSLNYDGYYNIVPSQEDLKLKRSPIVIISCRNFKNSTEREKYVAHTINDTVKFVV